MKNKHIVSSFMALALVCGCVPDSRDFGMPDSAVYFVDNAANKGVQRVTMYDVQSEVESSVYVYCSGYNGGSPRVSVSNAAEYVEYYNKVNNTDLKILPEEYYTLLNKTATVDARKAAFNIRYDVPALFEFAKGEDVDINEYVVALKLESEDLDIATVKDTTSLGYYFAAPDLKNAIAIVSGVVSGDNQIDMTVTLPFDNKWDFTFELGYDVTGCYGVPDTKRGNAKPAKYSCTPAPEEFIRQVSA